MPHWSTYRYTCRPFWTWLWDLPVSLMQLFYGKKQNFRSWDYSPQVVDFQINRCRIKGILLYILWFQKYLNFAPEIYLPFLEINIFKKLNICKALCTKDHSPFPVEGVNRLSPFLQTSTFLQYLSHRLPHIFLNALRNSSDGQKAQLQNPLMLCTKCH